MRLIETSIFQLLTKQKTHACTYVLYIHCACTRNVTSSRDREIKRTAITLFDKNGFMEAKTGCSENLRGVVGRGIAGKGVT